MNIRIQKQDFDLNTELISLTKKREGGGLVIFTGIVREVGSRGQNIEAMELEHYPGMTEKMLDTIAADAQRRWSLSDLLIIHRIGKLKVTENIVLVAVLAKHRKEAFDACQFIVDFLKSQAPFWKKEYGKDGAAPIWVDARVDDMKALERWGENRV